MTAIAAIHVAKKQLGLDDDTARDLYERVTGKRSLRVMSITEQERVVEELRRQGFTKASKPSRNKAEGRFAKKLQALWIAMWNLGLTRDRTDAGLTSFVQRQTRIDHTRFLRHAEYADKVIEALKGWMAREAGVEWRAVSFLPKWTQGPGYRIATAQFAILRRRGLLTEYAELQHWLVRVHGLRAELMTDAEWIDVMNELGDLIRRHT